MASSTALTKRPLPADSALMPPPPAPKRIKRPPKVLDEDTYTSALSHIIARDFFPGLLETESTQDYLNALEAGDDEWIDEAEQRVREVLNTPRAAARRGVSMTPRPYAGMAGETPRGGGWAAGTPICSRAGSETPRTPMREGPKTQSGETVNMNLGLTDFQAKYTSEDNESFNKVLDTQNEKKREKYAWLWNSNKIPSARRIAQAAVEQKLLTQRSDHDRNHSITEPQTPTSTNTSLILRPSADQDARPASISQIRPYEPRNTFMFAPSGDISETHPHLPSTHQTLQDASRAGPKSVSYTSTRLPSSQVGNATNDDDNDTATEADTSMSAIDAAIAGHPRHRSLSTAAPSAIIDSDGAATPAVNGYKFVDAEPTAAEELALSRAQEENPEAATASTAKRKPRDRTDLLRHLLGASRLQQQGSDTDIDAAPNLFQLQEKSKREDLHHRMVDKQLASKRKGIPAGASASANGRLAELRGDMTATGRTPTPRFASAAGISGSGRTPAGPPLTSTPTLTPSTRNTRFSSRQEKGNLTPAAQNLYSQMGRTPRGLGNFGADADVGGSPGKGRRRDWTPRAHLGVRARSEV